MRGAIEAAPSTDSTRTEETNRLPPFCSLQTLERADKQAENTPASVFRPADVFRLTGLFRLTGGEERLNHGQVPRGDLSRC